MPESHPIKVHFYPPSWTAVGGRFVQIPLAEITLDGSVLVCMECGVVVVPELLGAHERSHGDGR